ncbi:hypothetical protein B0A48_16322 [Cryoendolithus antarcticus]|uniref:CBM21 domain-containing protein n=1 Tax=Cryoendolithus antarcticus TaxID=1507870 RepID=A0A1V8SFV9_9PEZI|nr:hypothetical protein B0A48_16322 [Cryoendolithus antarcticus]
MTSSQGPPTPTAEVPDNSIQATDFAQRSSTRQSPPPVNHILIPTGAVISPPDSSEDSDGDDNKKRGRQMELRELQDAVRSIDQKKSGSPEATQERTTSASEPALQIVSPTALSAEARKISHSRSSTETAIIIPRTTSFAESPVQVTDDSDEDDDEDGVPSKPSLVRKKSGELVKPALRPSSRRRYSSMPGTPTYSKSVHFNDNDNQTRHFLQVDKPMAVSAGTSPVESYESESEYPFDDQLKAKREIKLTNFPTDSFERQTRPIRVERIFLASDMETLVGKVAVQNISFHKLVVARFTFDSWKTTSEVVAEFNNDPTNPVNDGCDRFIFQIKLSDAANVDHKTLLLCTRYNVNGQEYWDNNDDKNYQVDFVKNASTRAAQFKPASTLGARPLNAIPRSRQSPPQSAHGRGRQDSTDDEFGTRNGGASYHFAPNDSFLAESGGSIKLKPKVKRASAIPTGQVQAHNNLGGRYDFGVSLSAALTSAQDKLGRSSGLMGGVTQKGSGSYFGLQERKDGPTAVEHDKPELNGGRPAIGSDQYRDLVQKFCYFTTSGTGKTSTASSRNVSGSTPDNAAVPTIPRSEPPAETETADDASSSSSSGTSSPTAMLDGNNDRKSPGSALSPFVSRSNSPTPFAAEYVHRAASPTSFGYPYYNTAQESYFDSPQLTAIQG